jgi:hypothetical protein
MLVGEESAAAAAKKVRKRCPLVLLMRCGFSCCSTPCAPVPQITFRLLSCVSKSGHRVCKTPNFHSTVV